MFESDAPDLTLQRDADGVFAGRCHHEDPVLYRFRLDGGDAYPDPASRFQPSGPHGPSQVIDPTRYVWSDGSWRGPRDHRPVIYEMHAGTFTQEGTWRAAAEQLDHLADLGITIIEVMPIADFAGSFGWGYDGVDPFAPCRLYGTPDDLRFFIDRAHAHGIGVILDVVYNHFGPDGCWMREFAPEYFADNHVTDWGSAINFYGPRSDMVRAFFIANARYWIDEFHMDGLRLDATQNIYDHSDTHILTEIVTAAREAAGERHIFIVAENESQDVLLLMDRADGGMGIDALWNDDFHHSAHVALTGVAEAYYTDYRGTPQEFISASRWGFLYQGQYYVWQKKPRGTPALDFGVERCVMFVENHDQVANSADGLRMHAISHPGDLRALTALMFLSPGIPMLFQGQEYDAPQPFLYFADHNPELAEAVRTGRREFLAQFPSLRDPSVISRLNDPADLETFTKCKLDASDRITGAAKFQMHKDLIALSREEPFRSATHASVEGAVLSSDAFVLRIFGAPDALLIVNLGGDVLLSPLPEPLLAPPAGAAWNVSWCSEDARYGGHGVPPIFVARGLELPGHSALVLEAVAK